MKLFQLLKNKTDKKEQDKAPVELKEVNVVIEEAYKRYLAGEKAKEKRAAHFESMKKQVEELCNLPNVPNDLADKLMSRMKAFNDFWADHLDMRTELKWGDGKYQIYQKNAVKCDKDLTDAIEGDTSLTEDLLALDIATDHKLSLDPQYKDLIALQNFAEDVKMQAQVKEAQEYGSAGKEAFPEFDKLRDTIKNMPIKYGKFFYEHGLNKDEGLGKIQNRIDKMEKLQESNQSSIDELEIKNKELEAGNIAIQNNLDSAVVNKIKENTAYQNLLTEVDSSPDYKNLCKEIDLYLNMHDEDLIPNAMKDVADARTKRANILKENPVLAEAEKEYNEAILQMKFALPKNQYVWAEEAKGAFVARNEVQKPDGSQYNKYQTTRMLYEKVLDTYPKLRKDYGLDKIDEEINEKKSALENAKVEHWKEGKVPPYLLKRFNEYRKKLSLEPIEKYEDQKKSLIEEATERLIAEQEKTKTLSGYNDYLEYEDIIKSKKDVIEHNKKIVQKLKTEIGERTSLIEKEKGNKGEAEKIYAQCDLTQLENTFSEKISGIKKQNEGVCKNARTDINAMDPYAAAIKEIKKIAPHLKDKTGIFHSDSPEFTKMKDAMDAVAKLKDDSTPDEKKTALTKLQDASAKYKEKKVADSKGVRERKSKMGSIRLNYAERMADISDRALNAGEQVAKGKNDLHQTIDSLKGTKLTFDKDEFIRDMKNEMEKLKAPALQRNNSMQKGKTVGKQGLQAPQGPQNMGIGGPKG